MAAQAADELLNITGIQASFVLIKLGEDVAISARSLGDINVQVILEELGGGGHMTMAGAKIKDATIDEAIEKNKRSYCKKTQGKVNKMKVILLQDVKKLGKKAML